ncbi:uncharacterized protein LOC131438774 [Malaya genurostris]|uniref:uncharacterized protein LOC131433663 n=1 Tax=Malaya genurostris TaxID=325434 RepID=UPI0026F3C380|nr:uncharacterized protein LOC131433663 [Malaya genurostris]XP_058465010.1 uncharacterized protein LOC131438774 [Malaya genurostris]
MAENLSTDAFFVCFRNFQCRRGKVTQLYSDNGTNFVGAERELKRLLQELDTRMRQGEAAELEISWVFNPPAAPHFGGVWERLIGIIKKALSVMIDDMSKRTPTSEVLRSAFIQAEWFVNSRPLIHRALKDVNDELLTPFHAILGRPGQYAPPFEMDPKPYDKNSQARIQHAMKIFWDKWKKEYLPTLIAREKWTGDVKPIKIDDLVLMVDNEEPPGRWLKGRVSKLIVSDDGVARQADVITRKGTFRRAVAKLAILDVEGKDLTPEPTVKKKSGHAIMHISEPESCESTFESHRIETKRKLDKTSQPEKKRKCTNKKAKPVIRLSPYSVLAGLLTTAAVLSTANAILVTPVEQNGVFLDHIGTSLMKRGIWRTNIETMVSPDQDRALVEDIRGNISATRKHMIKNLKTDNMEKILEIFNKLCSDAIFEIDYERTRFRRSKGIFGFLWSFLFGENDIETELKSMRMHDNEKIHQLSESLVQLNGKTAEMGGTLNDRFYELMKETNNLKQKYVLGDTEYLESRLIEIIMLSRETIDAILHKYRRMRSYPLSTEELTATFDNISSILPAGLTVLRQSSLVKYEAQQINGTIVIAMYTVIVSKTVYEMFQIIPVPHTENHAIIDIGKPRILIDHNGEYFYPTTEPVRMNKTHFIVEPSLVHKELDCVSGLVAHKVSKSRCNTTHLTPPYVEMISLTDENQVLYYASDTTSIVIHCQHTIISPPYKVAVVRLDFDCKIQSNKSVIYGFVNREERKTNLYFKERIQIDFNLEQNKTELPKLNKPANPFNNKIFTILTNDDKKQDVGEPIFEYVIMGVGLIGIMYVVIVIYLRIKKCNTTRNSRRPAECLFPLPRNTAESSL